MRVLVRVKPGSKTEEAGLDPDGCVWIRLKAQPVDGKANQALLRFLSERLGVPLRSLDIESGHRSSRKRIQLDADPMVWEKFCQSLG